MNLRALESLVRVYQVASFSKAADLLGIQLSALSMQMKALEADLGTRLFDRNFRPPRLTPLGRRIAEQARLILRERDVLTGLCQPDDELVGTFQIGFIPSLGVRVLPRFLALARAEAPRASFQTSSGLSEALSAQVRTGQLDAAVVTNVESSHLGLTFAPIAAEPMAFVIPVEQAGLDLAELNQNLAFIHFMPSSGIGKLIAAAVAKLPDKPRRIMILDSIEATVECVRAGLGFAVLPRPDALRYGGDRVAVRTAGAAFPQRELVLATRADTHDEAWHPQVAAIVRRAYDAQA
jgi:DNA-binding transcriptional LysR family regulator